MCECMACNKEMEVIYESWETGSQFDLCRMHYTQVRNPELVDDLAREIYVEYLVQTKKK